MRCDERQLDMFASWERTRDWSLMQTKSLPDLGLLNYLFIPDFERGLLIARATPRRTVGFAEWAPSGNRGVSRAGYRAVSVGGQDYYVHRILWKMFTGYDPEGVLDHIDQDKLNNSIRNLQDVSHSENSRNVSRPARSVQ